MSTTVEALQASLASAATAAEVAALQTALTNVQSDLTDLLEQNNVFTGTLKINSASTVTAAESLGDKISIVSGDVEITHNANVDNAKLQAIVSKIKTITGKLTYNQSGTGTSPVSFDALTGVTDMDITQDGSISFAELVSAGAVELNDNSDTAVVTGVDFPKLESVTSFATGSSANTISFSKATKVDLASLVRYTQATLAINVNTDATIDLSSLTTTNATDGKQAALGLTITGPDTLTLATYETGTLSTDAEVVTLPKAVSAPTFTGTNLKELHMHNLQGALTFTAAAHPNLEILDVIGAVTSGSTASASSYNAAVTVPADTDLTTLTLAGFIRTASIDAANLESVTTSGGIQNVTIKNSTKMTTLTLGHTSKIGSYSSGSLTVTGNTKLESLTATSLDDISKLVIQTNVSLETIDFPALNSIGTDAEGTAVEAGAGALQINGNKLTATNLQLSSEEDAAVTVAGQFTSNSGLSDLETFIPLAAAKAETASVKFDVLEKITLANGDEQTAAYSGAADSANEDVVWAGASANDKSISVYSKTAGSGTALEARYQKHTSMLLDTPSVGAGFVIKLGLDNADYEEVVNGTKYTSLAGYDSTNPATYMDDVESYINAKLAAGGETVTVDIANDISPVYTITADALSGGSSSVSSLLTGATRNFTFKLGSSKLITATVLTNSTDGLVQAMVNAINTNLTTTWGAARTSGKLVVTPKKVDSGVAVDNLFYSGSAPTLGSISVWTSANSATTALASNSQTIAQVGGTVSAKKWRITATNSSLTAKEDNLEVGQDFLISTSANTMSFAAVTAAQLGDALSSTAYQLDFEYARARDASGVTAGATTSLVSWL